MALVGFKNKRKLNKALQDTIDGMVTSGGLLLQGMDLLETSLPTKFANFQKNLKKPIIEIPDNYKITYMCPKQSVETEDIIINKDSVEKSHNTYDTRVSQNMDTVHKYFSSNFISKDDIDDKGKIEKDILAQKTSAGNGSHGKEKKHQEKSKSRDLVICTSKIIALIEKAMDYIKEMKKIPIFIIISLRNAIKQDLPKRIKALKLISGARHTIPYLIKMKIICENMLIPEFEAWNAIIERQKFGLQIKRKRLAANRDSETQRSKWIYHIILTGNYPQYYITFQVDNNNSLYISDLPKDAQQALTFSVNKLIWPPDYGGVTILNDCANSDMRVAARLNPDLLKRFAEEGLKYSFTLVDVCGRKIEVGFRDNSQSIYNSLFRPVALTLYGFKKEDTSINGNAENFVKFKIKAEPNEKNSFGDINVIVPALKKAFLSNWPLPDNTNQSDIISMFYVNRGNYLSVRLNLNYMTNKLGEVDLDHELLKNLGKRKIRLINGNDLVKFAEQQGGESHIASGSTPKQGGESPIANAPQAKQGGEPHIDNGSTPKQDYEGDYEDQSVDFTCVMEMDPNKPNIHISFDYANSLDFSKLSEEDKAILVGDIGKYIGIQNTDAITTALNAKKGLDPMEITLVNYDLLKEFRLTNMAIKTVNFKNGQKMRLAFTYKNSFIFQCLFYDINLEPKNYAQTQPKIPTFNIPFLSFDVILPEHVYPFLSEKFALKDYLMTFLKEGLVNKTKIKSADNHMFWGNGFNIINYNDQDKTFHVEIDPRYVSDNDAPMPKLFPKLPPYLNEREAILYRKEYVKEAKKIFLSWESQQTPPTKQGAQTTPSNKAPALKKNEPKSQLKAPEPQPVILPYEVSILTNNSLQVQYEFSGKKEDVLNQIPDDKLDWVMSRLYKILFNKNFNEKNRDLWCSTAEFPLDRNQVLTMHDFRENNFVDIPLTKSFPINIRLIDVNNNNIYQSLLSPLTLTPKNVEATFPDKANPNDPYLKFSIDFPEPVKEEYVGENLYPRNVLISYLLDCAGYPTEQSFSSNKNNCLNSFADGLEITIRWQKQIQQAKYTHILQNADPPLYCRTVTLDAQPLIDALKKLNTQPPAPPPKK